LETLALQLAIPRVRMNQARLATIRQLAITLDRNPTGIDLVGIREQFYRELYDADQNPMLIELIEQLRAHVGRYLFGFWIEVEHDQTHRHLVELIASGDLLEAQSWCIRHIDEVRRCLLANLLDDRSDNQSVAAAVV
jgi:DNA-binding GntR family transcriptional regulator